jgi:hypothetical protein
MEANTYRQMDFHCRYLGNTREMRAEISRFVVFIVYWNMLKERMVISYCMKRMSSLVTVSDNPRFLYSFDSAAIFVATAIFVIPGFFPAKLLNMKVPYRSREESMEMDQTTPRN